MSRVDLDRIQAQLKVAIQSHQTLVAKMKDDPQNTSLQKQLHEMQSQITGLSEKQKSVVQLLRKELVNKPTPVSPSPLLSPVVPQSPLPVHFKAITVAMAQPVMIPVSMSTANHTLPQPKPLPVLAPKPSAQVTAPEPTTGNKLVFSKQKSNPVSPGVVAPLKDNVNNNLPVASGVAPKKGSTAPLRVPHFLANSRPSILQGSPRVYSGKFSLHSPLVPVSARRGFDTDLGNLKKASINKEATPEERKKLEFMATLDLITPGTLKELQSRRSERKRRSTANPQFSYGHYEPERKRAAATYLSQVPIQPGVRRRVFYQLCPVYMPPSTSNNGEQSDVHEDYCAVCSRSGELLMCDTCNLVYHLGCLEPPLVIIPQGLWSCPTCQTLNKQTGANWPGTLALVQSYISYKAAKEENKSKLSKQKQQLKMDKLKLEAKAKKLAEIIAQQMKQKSDLTSHNCTAQQSVDTLKNLIRLFQTS